MSLKFTPEMFSKVYVDTAESTLDDEIAKQAQMIFDQWFSNQPVVYGKMDAGFNNRQWLIPLTDNNIPIGSSHIARLCDVREIKKKKCKHELIADGHKMKGDERYVDINGIFACRKCGQNLKATWSAVDETK